MPLSKHIDTDKLIEQSRDDKARKLVQRASGEDSRKYASSPLFGRYGHAPLPKYQFPEKGVDEHIAYQLIHDELSSDGTPLLNLASFVTTRQPESANKLILENLNKNIADQDQYKASFELQTRCVSMLADLWKVPKGNSAIGTITAGSSEGLLLGGLALKKIWQEKVKNATPKRSFKEPGPNIIFASEAHCCVEKFARYFDVEARILPISKKSKYTLDPALVYDQCDENTIGVILIAGSTYTGHVEDVLGVNNVLDKVQREKGYDIPIHVDAASGGFVLPFAFPSHKWAFNVPRVVSINASGHKYGGVYVGAGVVLWRDEKLLPKELIFEMHYLGSTELSFTLNFSRPATPVIVQYYNFINLGFEGYKTILENDLANARMLARALEASGYFEVLSDNHRPADGRKTDDNSLAEFYTPSLPVVAFKWTDKFKSEHPHLEQKWLQILMKTKGWILPNYAMAKDLEDIEIVRAVIREELSEDMLDILVKDLVEVQESLTDMTSDFYKLAHAGSSKGPAEDNKKQDRSHQGYSRPC
ncbi:glutamate decarboxylase [Wallemia mellicola]|uniref:Glutamate decarboxylase n=1 Tax=Wallemia mellicola TaxID=1708541 RepID=A0A4T0NW58_9BASI|nr:glutamate decarboxylase [Wallemia mellicola]